MPDNLGQTIFVLTFMVVIILSMVFSTYIYTKMKDPLNNSTFATNQSRAAYNKFDVSWPIFDRASIVILIAMVAGVLISAFTIPTHPVYVIGNMLVMAVEVFVSFVITNAYYAITSADPILQTIASTTYPYSTYIVRHLPIFALVLAAANCIIMFSHGTRNQEFV